MARRTTQQGSGQQSTRSESSTLVGALPGMHPDREAVEDRHEPLRPGRGWAKPGGGLVPWVSAPVEYHASSVQACGLWPHVVGASTGGVGAPLGEHLHSGEAVFGDPLAMFRAGMIQNPGCAVLALTGRGKSTMIALMATGALARGDQVFFPADLKPDYSQFVTAMAGPQAVTKFGRGAGSMNMLDPGDAFKAADTYKHRDPQLAEKLRAEAIGRAQDITVAMFEVYRRAPLDQNDDELLREAIKIVLSGYESGSTPTLPDLIRLIRTGNPTLRDLTLTETQEAYAEAIHDLLRTMVSFDRGDFGAAFGRASTAHVSMDYPTMSIDVSAVQGASDKLLAGVLYSSWAHTFGAIEVHHLIADAGHHPRRHQMVVLDELWSVIGASAGMAARVDALTRTNRTQAVANVLCTHTFRDLEAVRDESAREKARGFVERSGMVVVGEVRSHDLQALRDSLGKVSAREVEEIESWGEGESIDPATGRMVAASLGKFLMKYGSKPGVPFRTDHSAIAHLMDTSSRWREPESKLQATRVPPRTTSPAPVGLRDEDTAPSAPATASAAGDPAAASIAGETARGTA
ncbi:hypothetical protein [Nocardioides panzhihuensis]|uniref:ATP/GTP-binding protein n=1 Tax=Nocardioides panzhihuensis TaxID=860243 RepID=A0A7Z0IVD3_9ACTN|nr:hypothetical protein [Nocardioides panzhihuensis]NYI81214.1 hypothetical protein [Nocardioides panzhihuensis]